MSTIDWAVLAIILGGISIYGTWVSRGSRTMQSYLRADNEVRWKAIGLSIMATQASAITFLSTPGQGFADGMRYIQLYFGLPLAMIILSATIVPKYVQLKIYTAYEFLERRFDLRVRLLTAFLFLLQRGMAAGLNIVAPAILLSAVLAIPLSTTTLIIGGLTIVYTTLGGAKAVAQTQKLQMAVMLGGMFFSLVYTFFLLPPEVSLSGSLSVAGALGRLRMVDFTLSSEERYTIWSGIGGGLFLSLSYFGTDQSQVQRYISGASLTESRLGLLFNAVLKLPMQFLILMCGVMVFVFYQFTEPPIVFSPGAADAARRGPNGAHFAELEAQYHAVFVEKSAALRSMLGAADEPSRGRFKEIARKSDLEARRISDEAAKIATESHAASGGEKDFVFISFVLRHLPVGLVGLLVAVIFCGGMSTSSAELNSLGTTTILDFYSRVLAPNRPDEHYVVATKLATAAWGALAMTFALAVPLSENLIQAINIIGSLFYGNILGIFILALSTARVRPAAVLFSAVVTQALVIGLHMSGRVGFLWYNLAGTILLLVLAWVAETVLRHRSSSVPPSPEPSHVA